MVVPVLDREAQLRVKVEARPHALHGRHWNIAFAQAFGAKMNETGMRAQTAGDHAPEMYRMDTVRNLDAWYEAFGIASGQRLYLEPGDRVHIW